MLSVCAAAFSVVGARRRRWYCHGGKTGQTEGEEEGTKREIHLTPGLGKTMNISSGDFASIKINDFVSTTTP